MTNPTCLLTGFWPATEWMSGPRTIGLHWILILQRSMTFLFLFCPTVFTTRCFTNRSGFGRLQKNKSVKWPVWGASILPGVITQGAMRSVTAFRIFVSLVGDQQDWQQPKLHWEKGSRSCFWMTIQNSEDTLFTVSPGFRNLPFPNSRVCPSMKGSGNLQRSFKTIQTWKS